jgi:WD40 repeat protein
MNTGDINKINSFVNNPQRENQFPPERLGIPGEGIGQDSISLGNGREEPVGIDPVKINLPKLASVTGETPKTGKSLKELSSMVFSYEGLQKHKFNFEFKGHSQSPDGTVYSVYCDYSKKKEGNYISASSPDGKVKWESRVGQDYIYGVRTGPDGTAYVRTESHLIAFDPEGNKLFDLNHRMGLVDHRVEPDGTNFFQDYHTKILYIVDKSGNPKNLPGHLRMLRAHDVKPGHDGNYWCHDYRGVSKFKFDENTKVESFGFWKVKGCSNEVIEELFPTKDGGVIVKSNYSMPRPMDGGKRPHPPMRLEHRFTKFNPSGSEEWRSMDLGKDMKCAMTPDERILFATNKSNSQGKFELCQMDEEGKHKVFAEVDNPISDFLLRPEDNHLFIKTEDGMASEFDSSGQSIQTNKFSGDKTMVFTDFTNDGRVFVTDKDKKELHIWNPQDNSLTRITDHKKDYSFKLEKDKFSPMESDKETGIPEAANDNKAPVLIKDDHVVIQGVKIKKKNSGTKFVK